MFFVLSKNVPKKIGTSVCFLIDCASDPTRKVDSLPLRARFSITNDGNVSDGSI